MMIFQSKGLIFLKGEASAPAIHFESWGGIFSKENCKPSHFSLSQDHLNQSAI